jgi:hypothetical protein
MPAALTQYNTTNYPKHPAKKLEKVLELFVKAAANEGLYLDVQGDLEGVLFKFQLHIPPIYSR